MKCDWVWKANPVGRFPAMLLILVKFLAPITLQIKDVFKGIVWHLKHHTFIEAFLASNQL